MRAQSETYLVKFQDWTLRIQRAHVQPCRLLLLLHGWTGDENSMWVFVRKFPRDYWMVAPRAPHATSPSGFSWRVAVTGRVEDPSLDDFQPSAAELVALIDEYAEANEIEASQFDVIGFSQGGALANTLALLYPERIGRTGILAGFMPRGAKTQVRQCALTGKPFFVAHGSLDELVRVEQARLSIDVLKQAGAEVTFCEDDVRHKVSAECLTGLESFFA